MSKDLVRKELKTRRAQVQPDASLYAGQRILHYLSPLFCYEQFLLYAPIQNEVSTKPLFDLLSTQGKQIFFPRIQKNNMKFYKVQAWQDLQIQQGKIPEPSPNLEEWDPQNFDQTIAIVPGIGFSPDGHRMGFGQGFYDRFFEDHQNLIRVGLGYEFQIVLKPWKSEPHDQAMNAIITPAGLWGSLKA